VVSTSVVDPEGSPECAKAIIVSWQINILVCSLTTGLSCVNNDIIISYRKICDDVKRDVSLIININ